MPQEDTPGAEAVIKDVGAQPIDLPRPCLRELLWQRASYRAWLFRHNRLPFLKKKTYMKYVAGSFLEGMRRKQVGQMYLDELLEIYEILAPHLPADSTRTLDIGCGIAGFDILLYRHFEQNKPEIWLLDKDESSPLEGTHYSGFNPDTAGYNDLGLSRLMLTSNGVPDSQVHTVNIHQQSFPTGHFDVVLSLLSWGFHYPVDFYVEEVKNALSPEGILILDINRKTDGLEKLRQAFADVHILHAAEKHDFVLAKGPKLGS